MEENTNLKIEPINGLQFLEKHVNKHFVEIKNKHLKIRELFDYLMLFMNDDVNKVDHPEKNKDMIVRFIDNYVAENLLMNREDHYIAQEAIKSLLEFFSVEKQSDIADIIDSDTNESYIGVRP
jgi:hypothetical protein